MITYKEIQNLNAQLANLEKVMHEDQQQYASPQQRDSSHIPQPAARPEFVIEETKFERTCVDQPEGADKLVENYLRDDESEKTRYHPHNAGRIQEGYDNSHSQESNEYDQDPRLNFKNRIPAAKAE